MGQGLGKHTPVVLSLGRENYEALLNRHGQWTRWRQSTKCACLDEHTQQPNIHCKRCGGRGLTYSFQEKILTQCIVMAKDTSGILILEDEYKNDKLVKVYDRNGIEYNAEKRNCFITLDVSKVQKGSYYNIVMERENLKTNEKTTMSKNGRYWILDDLEIGKPSIEGIYYKAPCDIQSIEKIIDSENNEFEVSEYRQNKVMLKEKVITITNDDNEEEESTIEPKEPLYAVNTQYIEPFIFGILNQNLNKADFQAMVEAQGDAIVIFPYYCDVAEGDVLTVLAGTVTQKDVICRTGSINDPLPAFFVSEVTKLVGNDGTEYENGVDFVLSGTNEIKWINDILEVGDGYSVTYKVYPTYSVTKNIPTLRSSENQRFPKKAIVKMMSSYSEQRKVNRQ